MSGILWFIQPSELGKQTAEAEGAILTTEVLEMQTVCKKHIPEISTQHIMMRDCFLSFIIWLVTTFLKNTYRYHRVLNFVILL